MVNEGINETNQYLTFKLDKEVYAFDLNKVREDLDYTNVTEVNHINEKNRVYL